MTVDGWISVDDRLPSEDIDVIFYHPYLGMIIASMRDGVFWLLGNELAEGITHWRELPTPPKGEWIEWDGNEDNIAAGKPYPVPSQTIVEVKYRDQNPRINFTESKAENFAWYYRGKIMKFEEKDDQIIAYRIIGITPPPK